MMEHTYTHTSGQLARDAGVTVVTVALYADRGWLDCVRSSNGMRLFRSGQAPKVREIYAARMANRGRRSAHPEAAA
jgi:DNA-binding transcriptional MerR regulator